MTAGNAAIPELDKAGLRTFGLTMGAIIAVLFGVVLPYLFGRGWPLWPWIVAAVFFAWGVIVPATLRPVYRGWMRFGLLLSKVTTPIILTLVYVVAVVPTAIILRLAQKDPLQRKFDDAESYRVESKPPSIDNLEKPY